MTRPATRWWYTVLVLVPLVGLYTIVIGALSVASTVVDRQGHAAHACARVWARMILWTTGVRVRVRGAWPAPGSASVVYVSNHQSLFDIPVLLAVVPGQLRLLAKAMLGGIPFIGWHLRRAGHVLVDRARPGPSVVRKMQRLIEHGSSLVVFPEGTRGVDGNVGRFKSGVFALAVERRLPIVPITIAGTRHVMRKGEVTVRPRAVDVTVHPPVSTHGLDRTDVAGLAARVRDLIAGALAP